MAKKRANKVYSKSRPKAKVAQEPSLLTTEEDFKKAEFLLKPLNSKEDLINWMYNYLDIKFPSGVIYPSSTHGPAEAMWRIYELLKTGQNEHISSVVMLSARDSYKTLAAAALETLCMLHFKISVGHLAAIKAQSAKAVQYVNGFFRKIRKYLEANGWENTTESKTKINWITDEGDDVYLTVLVATKAGCNSEHLPLLCFDEVDLVSDPSVMEEVKMVPSMYKGYFPLTVYLSTRKYSAGLMQKTLSEVEKSGGEIYRWNLLDVTARITPEIAKINEPKVKRYIARELPMSNIEPEEFELLTDSQKDRYEEFWAYAGIAQHPMLSVMRNMLVDRPVSDVGHLYKPISLTLGKFKDVHPDYADAQLLCNKPSKADLVFPRFTNENILTINQAIEQLTGVSTDITQYEYLHEIMMKLGIEFIGGGDWGFTNFTALPILALIPNGEIWLMDLFVKDNLELDDIATEMLIKQDLYNVDKWYVEQAYPAYLKTFKRLGMSCPAFTKVVEDGIAAMRDKIVDSSGNRRFKIIKTPSTQLAIDGFGLYSWQLDGKGDIIEGKPYHDKDGVSDIMDSIRYPFQNLFAKSRSRRGRNKLTSNTVDLSSTSQTIPTTTSLYGENQPYKTELEKQVEEQNKNHILGIIQGLTQNSPVNNTSNAKKRVKFS